MCAADWADLNTRPPAVKQMLRIFLVLILLLSLAGCRALSKGSTEPLSAAALSEEYEKSRAEARRRYDGKEIVVRGRTESTATMPRLPDDQGSVLLSEKRNVSGQQVICWFSRDQADEFARITGGENITVQGVFNGEAGPELKFCRLVKTE